MNGWINCAESLNCTRKNSSSGLASLKNCATAWRDFSSLLPMLPLQSNTSTRCDGKTLLWLGPRSWLLVAGPALPHDAFEVTRVALNAAGGALFDVSSSYVGWMIAGAGAARALNKRCPLDLHPRAFPAGHCAQSMLGHVNALLYKVDERPAFIVMTARSFAVEASRDLYASADTDGYRVVPATPFNAGTRAID